MKPVISVVICTYNGENLIKNCLNSVLNQKFRNFEVLCVDGMSSDNTQKIIKKYMEKDKRIKLIINEKQLPEGKGYGKWLGYKNSKGKIFGIIDQDNILQRNDLFGAVSKIFEKNKKIFGILGGMKHDLKDKSITRYISLFGTDSFFAYRSVDFLRNIQNLKKIEFNSEILEKINFEMDNTPITGGNCFFYDRKILNSVGGYTQDVLVIEKIIKKNIRELIIIPDSTKHYAESSFLKLILKKFLWGLFFKKDKNIKKFHYLPETKKEKINFYKNLIFNLSILPNVYYSLKIYKKSKDFVSFLFPIVAFFNTLAYGITYLLHK